MTAHVGWYVNIVTHEVAADLPADNSAAAQREEIKGIIRDEYYRFNRVRFRSVDGANRPISDTIDKRTRFLIAALPLNSSDTALDLIKTEARVALDDFALYARLTSGDEQLAQRLRRRQLLRLHQGRDQRLDRPALGHRRRDSAVQRPGGRREARRGAGLIVLA